MPKPHDTTDNRPDVQDEEAREQPESSSDQTPRDDEAPQDRTEALELSPEAAAYIAELEAKLDEATMARQRALADYRNFQRRSEENERRARQMGVSDLTRALLPVLDHFDLALQREHEGLTVEHLRQAMQIVQQELAKALQEFGVKMFAPEPGSPFDPNRHEAMMRQPSDEHPENTVMQVLQPGYEMNGNVLRPAKVAVSTPAE